MDRKHLALLLALLLALAFTAVAAADKGVDGGPTLDPWNSRLAIAVGSTGRFSTGAFPDPTTGAPTTGSYKTLYGWPGTGTSFTTVRIDGADSRYGESAVTLQPPSDADPLTNVSSYSYGDVRGDADACHRHEPGDGTTGRGQDQLRGLKHWRRVAQRRNPGDARHRCERQRRRALPAARHRSGYY